MKGLIDMKNKYYYNGKPICVSEREFTHALIDIRCNCLILCTATKEEAEKDLESRINMAIEVINNLTKEDTEEIENWNKILESTKQDLKVVELEKR